MWTFFINILVRIFLNSAPQEKIYFIYIFKGFFKNIILYNKCRLELLGAKNKFFFKDNSNKNIDFEVLLVIK